MRKKLRKLLADRDEGIANDSENLTVGGYPRASFLIVWTPGVLSPSPRYRTVETATPERRASSR